MKKSSTFNFKDLNQIQGLFKTTIVKFKTFVRLYEPCWADAKIKWSRPYFLRYGALLAPAVMDELAGQQLGTGRMHY